MTILDVFTIDFKSNASAAKTDVAALDKQISQLAAKGQKRSVDEQKELKELRKRRQEQIQDLKDTTRETDKLNDSFQNMIGSAIGAVAGYASFGALKGALVDANKLNSSLQILGKTYGQNGRDIKAYGAAVERSTGVPASTFYNFVAAEGADLERKRLPFNITRTLETLHNQLKNKTPQEAQPFISQIPGGEGLLPFLQLPDEQFHKAIKEGFGVAGNEKDFQAAIENEKAAAKTSQEFSKIATEIDTKFTIAVQKFNEAVQSFAHLFSGSPTAAAAAGGAAGLGATLLGFKSVAWIRGLFGGGAGAAGAASVSGIGASSLAAVLAAGVAATWGASAVGNWIGTSIRGSTPATSTTPTASNKQKILSFWQSQGYSGPAAAGWTANAQAESGFNPGASNGSHGGIYQWSQSRRSKILAATSIDVWNSSVDDQLKAAAWEANSMGLTPGAFSGSAGDAASLISNRFEIPSTTSAGLASEAARRAQIATSYGVPSIPDISSGGGRSISIKIDDVNIETQATDTHGIAREIGAELKNQIRMAISNIDDGEAA